MAGLRQIGWADPNAKDRYIYAAERPYTVPVYVKVSEGEDGAGHSERQPAPSDPPNFYPVEKRSYADSLLSHFWPNSSLEDHA